jgi:hypothetical protein
MGLLELDPRNDPLGYAVGEPPQRYRIREIVRPQSFDTRSQLRGSVDPEYELGDVIERFTVVTCDPLNHRYYHSLHESDQLFADLCARLIQEACRWFYDRTWEPLSGVPGVTMTDDDVREAIRRLDLGENKREADRAGKQRYALSDLPWNRQRALIERLYVLRQEFHFEKLGPASLAPSEFIGEGE